MAIADVPVAGPPSPTKSDRSLEPGTILREVRARTHSALASGALRSLASEVHTVEARGVPLLVRVLGHLDEKYRGIGRARVGGPNPFLPYEEDLFVGDLTATHVVLLNKYNVVPHHILLVTRAFRSQDDPLDADDFTALWLGLAGIDGLGFYNGGTLAGASQPHKHLQIVPTPLGAGAAPVPIEPLLSAAVPAEGIGRCEAFSFPHAIASTKSLAALAPAEAGRRTVDLVRAMGRAASPLGRPPAYNLLVTRRFALFVPRVREDWEGIAVNALGFAGSLLVRDVSGVERVQRKGPLDVLAFVAGGAPGAPGGDRLGP